MIPTPLGELFLVGMISFVDIVGHWVIYWLDHVLMVTDGSARL
jgi:hypothetical protein